MSTYSLLNTCLVDVIVDAALQFCWYATQARQLLMSIMLTTKRLLITVRFKMDGTFQYFASPNDIFRLIPQTF